MPPDNSRAADPVPERFAGQSAARTTKRLFSATRPKFFPASALPVVAGTAWGVQAAGQFDLVSFLLALLATICVHAAANVINDVGDDAGGTDRLNDDRIYPYTGGSRFIQAGIMSSVGMARLGVSLLAVAAAAGLALLLMKGALILWLGIAGVLLAVLYSVGPVKLSSMGLGEAAVGFGLGVLPVTGAAWLQSGFVDADLIFFSLPVSAWVAAILLINEVPDIGADAATGKRTLPVRLGLERTVVLYVAIHSLATAVIIWMSVTGRLPAATPIVPLLLLLLAARSAGSIRIATEDRGSMRRAIEATLAIHTLGSLWLTAAALFLLAN